MLYWYLIQLKPNGHRVAKENLDRQGFKSFLPLQNVTKRTAQRFIERQMPLFPGYMFVELDPQQSHWRKVNSTLGVARIVMHGDRPTQVPQGVVAHLMARCDARGVLQPTTELQLGQEVQLLRGPFANLVATIEEFAPDQRIWVLIELLGQASRISVNVDSIALAG